MRSLIAVIVALSLSSFLFYFSAGSVYDDVFSASRGVLQIDEFRHREPITGGNGFILCEPYLGVTAYHVATDDDWAPIFSFNIYHFSKERLRARVLYHSDRTDIAFFEAPVLPDWGCLDLAWDEAKIGETVFSVFALPAVVRDNYNEGYTVIWSGPFITQEGRATDCCRNYNALVQNQIGSRWGKTEHSNMITPKGSSGAPIVNQKGQVVGVVVGGFSFIDTIFIPLDVLKNELEKFMKNHEISFTVSTERAKTRGKDECERTRVIGKCD